jgi:hypothetical protein
VYKLLMFRVVSWMHYFSLAQQWFGIVCVVGLLWSYHILVQYLADVTMAARASCLLCEFSIILHGSTSQKTILNIIVVYCRENDLKALLALGIKDL